MVGVISGTNRLGRKAHSSTSTVEHFFKDIYHRKNTDPLHKETGEVLAFLTMHKAVE